MGSVLLIVLAIFVGLLLLVAFWAIALYNGLIGKRNRFRNAFAQIEVQLQRRYDLIPNLVETAKGYMSHEKDTLEAVIAARNQAMGAMQAAAAAPGDSSAMANLASAEAGLGGVLGRLMAVAEAYPDLKANQNMMAVQEELTSTENKVAFARQAFNDAVTLFNTARETFPAVLIAGLLGFKEAMLFEVDDASARSAPKVNFGG
ncbi:MAG: LemA family protein [Planctomycetota bacterium]|jgi:LemA protein|nr:LemA family protein [Phycisphaerales bacterium]MEC8066036.1 LemA family protein [Planctomycetota bacterium]MDP7400448.1 LemA family protein [Phycisphaerales bacterium]MEC8092435.1 LemA family protein [Planctomycetota bacterium]MEC8250873.1 LemA family protein [Planctomycetota bacterium]